MATYGEPGKNSYTISGIGGILSNVVNENGVSDVYKQGAFNTYTPIATYNPSTGAITPYANANLSSSEINALTSNKTNIKNASVSTATAAGLDTTKANQLMSPNVASTGTAPAAGGTTPAAAGATPTGGTTTEGSSPVDLNQSVGSRVNNYSYQGNAKPTLVYPVKRKGEAGSDYIKFTVLEYKKSGLSSPTNVQAGGVALVGMEYRERNPLAYVYLPIQNGIIDSMSVDWGSGEINPITAAFASAAFGVMSNATDPGKWIGAMVNEAGVLGDKFKTGSPELRLMALNHYTQQAVGTPGLLSRTMGAAINNNLELLFNGPMLRSFTFNFKLTPRNADEATLIKQIIRTFKKSMVPSLSTAQLFLLAPNVFKIQYIYTGKGDGNDLHPYLNKIKVAALRDFSVNYAPDGNYMTYRDGSMTQYDLSMTFGEIDPIYEQDYERDEGLTGMGW